MRTTTATGEFTPLVRLDDLPVGVPTALRAGDSALCAIRGDDGGVHVYLDRCPHRGTPISEGRCENGILRCAVHAWEFEVDGGAVVWPSRAPFGLTAVESRVVDGALEVRL